MTKARLLSEKDLNEKFYKEKWQNYELKVKWKSSKKMCNKAKADISIKTEDGQEYVATFVTVKHLQYLLKKSRYFLKSSVVVVQEVNENIVRETIEDLIKKQKLERFFQKPNLIKIFEEQELERFLELYCTFEEIISNFPDLYTSRETDIVRRCTKKGIKEGITDFLKEENIDSIYFSNNQNGFYWDNNVGKRVTEKLESLVIALDIELNNIPDFVEHIYQAGRSFMHPSYERYLKLFC